MLQNYQRDDRVDQFVHIISGNCDANELERYSLVSDLSDEFSKLGSTYSVNIQVNG